jgi:hypothetical protein
MNRYLIYMVSLLVAVSMAFAVTDTLDVAYCDQGGHHFGPWRSEVCASLQNSKLSTLAIEKQKQILLDLFLQGDITIYDRFKFVNLWNSKMIVDEKPPEVEGQQALYCQDQGSKECIADQSWLEISSVENSLTEGQTLYIPEDGVVQAIYGYGLDYPEEMGRVGQTSCWNKPEVSIASSGSHCGFTFSQQDESKIRLYVNGNQEVEQEVSPEEHVAFLPYTTSSTNTQLRVELEINNKVTVEVYDWVKVGKCGSRDFPKVLFECQQSSTSEYTETKRLTSQKTGQLHEDYDESYTLSFHDKETEPVITFESETPEYKLQIGGSSLQRSQFKYRTGHVLPPYNFLWLAKKSGSYSSVSDGKIIDEEGSTISFVTTPDNVGDCSIEIFNPYNRKTISCDATQEDSFTPKITITSNRSSHSLQDTVAVEINITENNQPVDGTIMLTYGPESKTVSVEDGTVEVHLEPILGDKNMVVTYGDYTRTHLIFVYDKAKYVQWFTFGFGIALLFVLYKAVAHVTLRRRL